MPSIDIHSATWSRVRDWAEEQLAIERESLEFPGVSEREADQCRGAIEKLKSLLALADTTRAGD